MGWSLEPILGDEGGLKGCGRSCEGDRSSWFVGHSWEGIGWIDTSNSLLMMEGMYVDQYRFFGSASAVLIVNLTVSPSAGPVKIGSSGT